MGQIVAKAFRLTYTFGRSRRATPPWITPEQIAEMRRIYLSTPPGYHVDHIVPLRNALVCGLNVPWNLQVLPGKCNLAKSNTTWPDSPFENLELFSPVQKELLFTPDKQLQPSFGGGRKIKALTQPSIMNYSLF